MSSSFALPDGIVAWLAANNPPEHPELARCRAETAALPQARMQISPEQGAFLAFLVRLTDARLAVEVGTFTGYSSLATALALRANAGPGGRLYAFDRSADWTGQARAHWRAAGVDDMIELTLGDAQATLDAFADSGWAGRIDFAFVDADKTGYRVYLDRMARLLRPGGLAVFDNTLWSGRVADPSAADDDTLALRAFAEAALADPRFETVQIAVGDGLLLARKR